MLRGFEQKPDLERFSQRDGPNLFSVEVADLPVSDAQGLVGAALVLVKIMLASPKISPA